MSIFKLSFGSIIIIQNNLAEVIVNQGVVMDDTLVDEYHKFVLNHLMAPCGLLVNKKNSYTYTFSAQKRICNLKEIEHMAVVTQTSGGVMSTQTLLNVSGSIHKTTKLFEDREEALIWLKKKLA
ncbi:hypothetical protein FPF71_10880 [Algibacter amylolyticus]|uniref:STAS/SEC14 domain-containing protein n=1 Tax=Algibacter amylolyticus TaxID=1608400 RepID=A0A5M7B9M8_9FLAO|nr:hypothetical protein [Algibacter amylolyticus]KAA5824111.1 hypothetical protein F2B50_10880 [Algibacter amylolyticus]MBB5269668.1 hypothetical protein [Algibacter amylolyticus]TSJ74588.1 hypothetical protein FPF71_10880 [Algibacter amylolyticus]